MLEFDRGWVSEEAYGIGGAQAGLGKRDRGRAGTIPFGRELAAGGALGVIAAMQGNGWKASSNSGRWGEWGRNRCWSLLSGFMSGVWTWTQH